jgi:hypothetical protein
MNTWRWCLQQLATVLVDGGLWRGAVMCRTEWDGNGNVRLFPPCGCCCWWVAGPEEKGDGNRVIWSYHRSNDIHKMELRGRERNLFALTSDG